MTRDSDSFSIDDKLTSHWPLPDNGARQITPKPLLKQLSSHILAKDLHPLGVGFYPKATGHKMLRSEHTNYLLIYCSAGNGRIRIGENTQRITIGDLILLPPSVLHEYQADDQLPWSIYWLHFDGELAEEYASTIRTEGYRANIGLQHALIEHFERLFNMRERGISVSTYLTICAQVKLLLLTASILSKRPEVEQTSHNSLHDAIDYMRNHVDEDLHLEQLASLCNLSKFHFVRKFKTFTGHTPIQYFIQLKIEKACRLLDNTQLSIKEISAQLGYPDSLYFSRLFKRVLGVSPKNYRQLHSA